VNVVEDSEIYNFPITHFVHFSSIFERKMSSRSPRLKRVRATPRRAAMLRAHSAPRLHTDRLGVRAAAHPEVSVRRLRLRLPQADPRPVTS
jgi:hypothetical protein